MMIRKPRDIGRQRGAQREPPPAAGSMRIAKAMARAGLCSRRDAEAFIAAGRVAVNGAIIASPAVTVTARDRVLVDGKALPRPERTRLFLHHKPAGLVSTHADPQGRPTVFDALPAALPRLVSVGRLDVGTEGLLLLTNDGSLARVLELPRTRWLRRYRVRAHGRVHQADLDRLRDGITIDGVHYGPIEAALERQQGSNAWLAFAIREGKNREVRNVLAHLGLQVTRLIRIAFGPFGLDGLAPGAIVEVATEALRRELGDDIIALAGCDFAAPLAERPAAPTPMAQGSGVPHPARQGHDMRGQKISRDGGRGSRPAPALSNGRDGAGASSSGAHAKKPRPRRGHAWRQDDAPLRRHYRGSRREELTTADEPRPDKRAGLLTDRKGRRVLVERFGAAQRAPQSAEPPPRARQPHRPPRDRASGPRPARPKPRSSEASGSKPPRPNPSRPNPSRSKSLRPNLSRSKPPRQRGSPSPGRSGRPPRRR